METMKPPIRAVSTGKVYRRDPFDATHSPMFYQVDVLVVDEGITMGHLKGTLEYFLKRVFDPNIKMRFRPGGSEWNLFSPGSSYFLHLTSHLI